jgi:hypothetical protein
MGLRIALTAAAVAALTVPMSLMAPAEASHGGVGVRSSGSCDDGSHWKLKAHRDDGRLKVEAEVDSNRAGQSWHWALKRDGHRVRHGITQTRGRSGSFEIERRLADRPGTDRIVFRARHAGAVCRGAVRL